MSGDVVAEVRSIVEPLLIDLGFELDGVEDFDEGGIPGTVVYYRSSDCKIQIYNSSRQGSINCMIAPLSADNEFCHRDPSSECSSSPNSLRPRTFLWRSSSNLSVTSRGPTTNYWKRYEIASPSITTTRMPAS